MWKKNKKGLYSKDLQLDLEKLQSINIPKFDLQLFAEDEGLFLIDGEDAGSSPWEFSSLIEEGSNDFALDSNAKNHGSYGYKATFDGSNDNCYGRYEFTARDSIYVRYYLYISSDFDLSVAYGGLGSGRLLSSSWTTLVQITLSDGTGDGVPSRWYVTGNGVTSTAITQDFSLATWHYVEIYWLKESGGGGNGQVTVWIDGTQRFNETSISTGTDQCDKVYIGGCPYNGYPNSSGQYIYYDDIKADTSYIGPYSAEEEGIIPQSKYYIRMRRNN